MLVAKNVAARKAEALATRWLKQGDFLLLSHEPEFTHVIGNPPYVRQELIPDVLMAEHRRRYAMIFDRADIYVPFIEQSLSLLAPGGCLGSSARIVGSKTDTLGRCAAWSPNRCI
jgi:methylase of polypeptide subunit release factors